ncbi:DNA-processing protein DprA [Rhodoferax sp.]|uniref:DNA-processing protein DprA n=1 Tax=Rhodoferax sp. TaxID=50421 RepID=UPI002ACEC014|nr:DNA-processing protein DprA [Rhodoferax sp.]MDZ7920920.1 DNA-processing protein DprA [Rhodoferax sp.]
MERDELSAWLRLLLTPGVGSSSGRRLLARFGLPQEIFAQSASQLEVCVSAKQADSLRQTPAELTVQFNTTWEWLSQNPQQRHVLTLGDPCYPAALLDTEDPPLLLYAMGDADHLQQGWGQSAPSSIAVVGSRNPTAQGVANARQFSQTLAQAGLTVVSGLALGIDGAAHEGALEGAAPDQLATIAVVGTGLDRVYPKAHFQLAHKIAQQGLLISEYPLGTPPLSANFPKRNRIISGLSHATLVVEAALQSGSLITARLAVEQGKDVFAIPGSIHATQARGCHALIKQGAKLVESAQDILEEFALPIGAEIAMNSVAAGADTAASNSISGLERSLLDALAFEPAGLDALQARTGLDTPTLQALLMGLELQGHVARLPGSLFQRLAQS